MFGYIYKTVILKPTSSLHNHFYIGQKQSPVVLDYYFGSGKKLRDYFNKHCNRKWSRHIYPEEAELLGLHREILATAENIDELNNLEEYYVNKELNNPLCLNLMTGGLGRVVKKEVIESMAQTKRNGQFKWWTNGKEIKMSKELCKKLSLSRKGKHFCIKNEIKKGEHRSLDTEFKAGLIPWNKGTKGLTKANSGSFQGEHKGSKWYNNGIRNIRTHSIPFGKEWKQGMLPIKRKKKL